MAHAEHGRSRGREDEADLGAATLTGGDLRAWENTGVRRRCKEKSTKGFLLLNVGFSQRRISE